ncbi:MAG: fibronectin type III domain-containing protein, partial [Bacteroidales bacterium]|nr:fibronectin type III domain-containing protein [Bacteroidales bacterium]
MKKKLLFVFALALLVPWAMRAQTLDTYTFSTGVDASKWITITGGDVILVADVNGSDSKASTLQNIGFIFPFAEDTYSSFSVNTDGNLRLGTTVTGTSAYSSPFSSSNANLNNPKINFMGCDGKMKPTGWVKMLNTVDGEGDSLLVVEFNTSTYNNYASAGDLSWQVHLYPNGDIVVVYGAVPSPLPAVTRQAGICVNATDIWMVNASHVATHYTAGQTTNIAANNWPEAGRYYSFVRPLITCPGVGELTVSNITSGTADLSWTEMGTASTWEVVVTGSSTNDVLTASTTPSLQLNSLDPDTEYEVTVRAICGAGDTSTARTRTFRTACLEVASTDLPFSYGFEDATASGTSGNYSTCWGRYRVGTTSAYPYPYTSYKHSGNYGLYLYGTSAITSWTSLPLFEDDVQDLYLSFWAYKGSATGGTVRVGVMTDPSDLSTFTELSVVTPSATSTWEYFEVPLDGYTGTGRYIAFVSGGNASYIDDITVMFPPSCVAPSLVEADEVTGTSASINLTGSSTSFLMLVNSSGSTTVDTIEVSGDYYFMDNLTPGTTYELRVHSLCGGDTSLSFNSYSFTTECDVMQLPVVFDAEGLWGGTAAAPQRNCWDFVNGGNTTYNWRYSTSTSSVHGGTTAYYYYGTTTQTIVHDNWMITPVIDFTGNDEITLWVKTGSATVTDNYHGHFALYANDADSASSVDTAGFEQLDIVSPDAVNNLVDFAGNQWRMVTIGLPSTLMGEHRLAFVVKQPTYSYYMDDISIHERNSCVMPFGTSVQSYDAYTAVLTWNDTTEATEFEILYHREGSSDTATVTVNDTTAGTIENLTPNTVYYVMVRTVCSDGNSEHTYPISFRTACAPYPAENLPFEETFESYTTGSSNSISPCWNNVTLGTTSNYAYPNTRGVGGGNSLHMGSYNASTTSRYISYVVLPVIDTALNELQIDFDVMRYSSYTTGNTGGGTQYYYDSQVQVGIITNPDDTSTFTVLRDIDISNEELNSVFHYTVSLEGWNGGGRIAFLVPVRPSVYHYNYVDIDNVTVSLLPECRQPVSLHLDSAYTDALDLSWVGSGSEFELQCSRDRSFTNIAATTTVYENSGTLYNLETYKNYYVRVRSVCYDTVSQWSDYIIVHTVAECGDVHINDTIGNAAASSYSTGFYSYISGTTRYATGFNSSIYTEQDMAAMGILSNTHINGISLHSGSMGGTLHNVKVYLTTTSLSGFNSTTAGNDTISRDTMSLVFSGDLEVSPESWIDIPFDTVFPYNGGNLLVNLYRDTVATGTLYFYYTSTSPNYYNIYGYRSSATAANNYAYRSYNRPDIAFDICTETPTCTRPAIITLESYTDNSVTLSWGDVASMYEVVLSTTSGDPEELTNIISTTCLENQIVIEDLTPNTVYYAYVRSICGNDASEWSFELSFRTACAPLPLPYSENFEAYGSGAANPISPCWTKGTSSTTAYPYPYSSNAISGSRSLYFYAAHSSTAEYYSYAALPMFQDSVKNLSLNMNVRRYSTTTAAYMSRLVVGVMTNPNDISTFFPMDTIDLTNEPALSIHGYEFAFSGYEGEGQYIALYDEAPQFNGTASYSYIYVDDITVDYIPSCPRVDNVTFNNIATTEATVHWNANSSVSSYEVEYGPSGFDHGLGITLTTSEDSIDLVNLAPSTKYDVYVRALCSADESGEWSFVQNFRTACGLTPLPIVMDFEGLPTGTSSAVPSCWTRWNNNLSSTYSYYPYVYTSASNAHGGSNLLYSYMSTSTTYPSDFIFSSPAIDTSETSMDNVVVTFWAKRSTNAASLIVGAISNPDDATTFIGVDTVELVNTYAEYTVEFAGLSGLGNHVAFRGVRTGTQAIYYYIDDIVIEAASPCERSFDLYVTDATQNSAILGWTDTIGSTSWHVRYAQFGSPDWQELTVTTNPFSLTGLSPMTGYRFQVAPVCASGEMAEWSRETHEFFTTQIPAAMPYSYDFEDSTEWGNWQFTSNNATSWARGNIVDGNTTYVAHLSTDGGTTWSWMPTSVTNAAMYRDIDFGSTPRTVTVSFTAIEGGRTDGNYDGISVMLVDPTTPIVNHDTYLDSPWGRILWVHAHNDTVWTDKETTFDGVSGVQRLVFIHYSNSHSQSYIDIPSAIDNVVVSFDLCDSPFDLVASNITDNSMELDWQGEDSAAYIVDYRPAGTTGTDLFVNVVGTHAVLPNMLANTSYNIWVRKVCDTADNYSSWSSYITVSTLCGYQALPYSEDFEGVTGVAYSTTGSLPNCWEGWHTGSNAYTPHVTNGSTYSYAISGTNAVTLSANASSSGTPTYGNAYLRLPDFLEATNTLTVAYWLCTESNSNGILSVGYLTGTNYETDFVAVHSVNASSATQHSGNGLQNGRGIFDTASFTNVPEGNYPVVFRWTLTSGTTLYSASVDDISVWSSAVVACNAPAIDTVSATESSVTMGFSGNASSYEVAIVNGEWSTPGASDVVSASGTTHTFTGLTAATNYTVGVRSVCPGGEFSPWTTRSVQTLPVAMPTTYTVSAATADATMGSATVSPSGIVNEGTQVTFTATANSGYHFVAWTSGTTQVSTANPYTTTVSSNLALTATFEADGQNPPQPTTYTVTLLTASSTMGSVS